MRNIREFFWPLLEGEPSTTPPDIDSPAIIVETENCDEALKFQTRFYENEEDRRKSIEGKASLFLGSISIASSLVIAASTLFKNTSTTSLEFRLIIIASFVLSVYSARTVWFAVRVLQRGNYHVPSFSDINIRGSKEKWSKHLIASLVNKAYKNQATINKKVDYLTLAQEYYKRAIVIICLYALMLLIFSFIPKKIDTPINNSTSSITIYLNDTISIPRIVDASPHIFLKFFEQFVRFTSRLPFDKDLWQLLFRSLSIHRSNKNPLPPPFRDTTP